MSSNRIRWMSLPLRLGLGFSFMAAGLLKLIPPEGPGYANIMHELTTLGLPPLGLMGWMVGIIEFSGGLAIVIGLFTRLFSAMNALQLISLILIGLIRGGIPEALPGLQFFPYQLPGYHLSLISAAGLLSLLIAGPGALSVDEFLAARRSKKISEVLHAKKNEAAPLDIPTLIAIAVVAWIVFNELHTVVGHGGACILLGYGLQGFTTTHAVCSNPNPSFWGQKIYLAWGHVANFAAVIVFFRLLRSARNLAPSLRYFFWISLCFNIFNIGNALLVTALFPGGDWSDFAIGLKPAILWQGGLTLLGVIFIVAGFRLGAQFWEPFIGGDEAERRRRITRLTWVSCLTAFITSVLPALLSPLVFFWGLLQALLAPISVFWLLLLPLWRWGPPVERQPVALPLARSVPWLVVGIVAFILFAIQALGVGTFPASLLR